MSLKERVEQSNKEVLIVEKQPVQFDQYVATDKILIPITDNPHGKEIGFFKKVKGKLQVHIRTFDSEGLPKWTRFWVVNATDEERSRNVRLNIIDTKEVN